MPRLFVTQYDAPTRDLSALLGQAALTAWGLDALPSVARATLGKPFFPGRDDLHFNLSHSGPYGLCALGSKALGCDIEVIRPRRPSLPQKLLSPAEFDWFCSRGSRWEDFYTLWTLKEAHVKCLGTGLRRPPREIAVPLVEEGGSCASLDGMVFTLFSGAGWRAALCSPEGTAALEWLPPGNTC